MTRRTTVLLIFMLSVLGACNTHLGKNYGDASRAAFSAQTKRTALPPAGMDEHDAAAVERERTATDESSTTSAPSDPYATPR